MPVPATAGSNVVDGIVLEDRGVVDEQADRPERLCRLSDQGLGCVHVGQVGFAPPPRVPPRSANLLARATRHPRRERLQWIATAKPCAARSSTIALPMRFAPPVTNAVLAAAVMIDPCCFGAGSLPANAAAASLQSVLSFDGFVAKCPKSGRQGLRRSASVEADIECATPCTKRASAGSARTLLTEAVARRTTSSFSLIRAGQ